MASTSIPTPKRVNHVFLSFRGEDTRNTFTSHLFNELERRGIKTFKDDHDLERGGVISKELIKAIEDSMFAIIILSPNYASSTWCLDELQKILECKNTFGQIVFPIFHGVDPSDVRYQRGSFAKAFEKHEERFRDDRTKVDTWKNALREIAGYCGWDSKDRNEAKLIETIVDDIQKKLIPRLPSSTKNLVGIDSRKKEVYSLLGMGLNDVRFIGIWGMGGIGKTTIARLVYEAIKEEFEVSCFLADIREFSETKGLAHIQWELLHHLNIKRSKSYDLHDGKKIIASSFCNKKVLLVLDDVSELSQLDNLAGNREWFGPGSRIIITSRDKHLLVTYGVDKTYEVKCLLETEAFKLFCLNAFKRDQPKEGYWDLCKEVVKYTGGLPLALNVLGSHLHGRTVEVWFSALEQIRSILPSEILATLKISYDSLEPMQKKLFLDVAFFFKGWFKDQVMDILESCGDHPKIGIDILIERSLVTIDTYNNTLGMHDLLQEMGRHIVYQESHDPGRRSRLWSQKDIDQVLTKNKGTDEIQGIVLTLVEPYEARWSTEAFSKTSQLWLLKVLDWEGHMILPHGLKCLPSSLKVLDWDGCPLKTLLPLTNQLDEIVYLKLYLSKIEHLWHRTQCLGKLKTINLSFSFYLKQTPDFAAVPNLESLDLSYCESLTEVHPSLLHHEKLVVLNFHCCESLEALPCKMEMSSLKELNLSCCSKFKYLPEFGVCMKHLSKLSLDSTALTKLPPSLRCLVGLANLNLESCKNLVIEEHLPLLTSYLGSLKIILSFPIPYDIRVWTSFFGPYDVLLSRTGIEYTCEWVVRDYEAQGKSKRDKPLLVRLSAINTDLLRLTWLKYKESKKIPSGFKLPPFILCIPFLKRINLSYCNVAEDSLPDNCWQFPSLVELDLTGNNFVKLPSSISKLPKLQHLRLNWCEKLQQFPELPSSIVLDASYCPLLETSKFNPIRNLPELPSNIQVLDASNGSSLETSKFTPNRPCCLFALLLTMLLLALWFLPSMLIP